ncbi:PREDICTED: E3 ubiquitin-protein ligase TM129 [Ceratosolen solmsi marchali]|uniref:E3 ubiquitin-protein ligase TM129 n=1 Tax=Ceratosolen solmsi marchali TaxID=326594 RepID=A0AAJ7DUP5_9HYME|nr:PREDICTED: E3 ubiquitin-protein ligase TM129 [Ceratosolen solmsi marchali]
MMSTFFFYSLAYFLFSSCVVYPPSEFVSAGLTIKNIFANLLGNENEFFIQYHIKRSIVTVLVHSVLPFGYLLGLILTGNIDADQVLVDNGNPWWLILIVCTLLGPLFLLYKILQWSSNNWSTYPIAKSLAVYCNNTTWQSVATDINIEFSRVNTITINTNSITKVVATDNWIIKVTPYQLYFAHQSDTSLIVNKSDTHNLSSSTRGKIQYISIKITPNRSGARAFNIRLKALDFKNLQDKITRPIIVLESVVFHRTLLDKFIEIFKEQIAQNPEFETTQELDQCMGCMQVIPNIKLNKLCSNNVLVQDPCVSCYCRPLWCVDCIAKWFASRQDKTAPETWLSSKSTCPVCRAKFCILDVSYVKKVDS